MRKVLIVLLFLLVLTACGESDVKNNEEQTKKDEIENVNSDKDVKKEETSKDDGVKKDKKDKVIQINEEFHVNGLDINIKAIEVKGNMLHTFVSIENTDENTKSFFPDQGSIVIGNKQIEADFWGSDGKLAGEIYGGVVKEGVISYDISGVNFDEIEEIRFIFGQVLDEVNFNFEEFEEVISIP